MIAPPDPPRGFFQARVDEKGRLKLPADLRAYILGFGKRKVFVTSLDRSTVRIYPDLVWKDNQKVFEEFAGDPQVAEDVAFTADDLGGDCDMDDQGRVLVPQELRQLLKMEGQPVWLKCFKGVIHVYTEQVYLERKQRATENLAQKLKQMPTLK